MVIFYTMSRTVKSSYTKSKKSSKQCRNNGNCDYCRNNRLHKHQKKDNSQKEQLKDI